MPPPTGPPPTTAANTDPELEEATDDQFPDMPGACVQLRPASKSNISSSEEVVIVVVVPSDDVYINPFPAPAARYCPLLSDAMEFQTPIGADVCVQVSLYPPNTITKLILLLLILLILLT